MDADEARGRLTTLQHRLEKIADRDPDQEVQGIAVPVLDAIINAARGLITVDDTVGSVVRDLISPEAIADGSEPVRAVDALVVTEQLLHSLPPAPAAPIDLVVPRGKHDVGNWFDVDF